MTQDGPSTDTAIADAGAIRSNVAATSALPVEETERLTHDIVAALKTVFDPEIPADIYELGLIYKVDIKDDRAVAVEMTRGSQDKRMAAIRSDRGHLG